NLGRELTAAVDQSRLALEQRQHEEARRTVELAAALADHSNASLATALDSERRAAGARALIVFGHNGEVLAASGEGADTASATQLPRELLEEVRTGESYSSLEPDGADGYVIFTAASLPDPAAQVPRRFVVARHVLPPELSGLADALMQVRRNYDTRVLPSTALERRLGLTQVLL